MGDYSFSPVMELSAGISLEYSKKIRDGSCLSNPLFFCFPEKQSASLWTSLSILNNYYFEDYVNSDSQETKFKLGDRVKIFNCIAIIERISNEKVFLKFKDQGNIPLNKKLQKHLNIINSQRPLSKKSRFSINYGKLKENRNPISKILVPNYAETINQNSLNSKVLLIAGRGNVKKIHRLLNEFKIYDEPLSKIYPENKNLIIKPDLESFKGVFEEENLKGFNEFKNFINKFYEVIRIESAKEELKVIAKEINNSSGISEDLDNKIENFFTNYEVELPEQIDFLRFKYPGVSEVLPSNLRAVIINDITQINVCPNTIKGFLDSKIPVIFISSRDVRYNSNIELYSQIFKKFPDYYRINWNQNKINALSELNSDSNYIDQKLWDKCLRFSRQSITINISEGNELDTLTPKLLKHIKNLNDFEILQKAFYDILYPILYAIKNSSNQDRGIVILVNSFSKIFDNVKNHLPENVRSDIEKAILLCRDINYNSKDIISDDLIFTQVLPNHLGFRAFIPTGFKKMNNKLLQTNKVIFSGYPYLEYSGKFLHNACCVDFVPDIKILCWPNEGALTYSYLNRRIIGSYFTDNITSLIPMREEFLLKSKSDFKEEIDKYLRINKELVSDFQQDNEEENTLEFLHSFKYIGYGSDENSVNTYSVKCSIINFKDGSFMFLPNGSRILAQTERQNGILRISKRSSNELSINDKIFKYVKDRHTMRNLAKSNNSIIRHFEKLEYWKSRLEEIYVKCNWDVNKLKLYLEKIKHENSLVEGNPTKLNLRNWLFDDEFLKPESENLRIILLASGEKEIDNKLKELEISYQQVVSYTIGLSSQIKNLIKESLSSKTVSESDLTISVKGVDIVIQSRTITSIDDANIEIDYQNTRKILC
ncbi:hypothetical protein [Maribacter sp. Asnod2-G09]|uniref:hypothetical protein n=1 Tax=Maribacter sp. Asnod2-G09 TaxID=3160577 RepID=UPI00386EA919